MAGAAHYIESLYPSNWKELSKREWADVMLDFSKFVSHHIIINKQGEAVQMKMNEAQEKVAELILRYVFPPKGQNPRPIKLVIHKSRQMGISTILTLIEKYIASRKTKINLLHILPDEKLAKNYWIEKGEPLWQGSDPQILPAAKATNTPTPYIQVKEYADTDMQVNIRYTGSNSKSAMRSSTNHIVILDEYAFFENVRRLEKGVLASQPKTGMAITAYCSCVTKDTLILPDTGMEEIGEHPDGYSPADKNLYGLGGNHHADQYYGTGLVPTKKIKTKAGFEIECTPNHRLWTVDGWKRADEFNPGDRIDIQLGQQQFGDYVCDDFVKRPYKKGFKAKDIDLTLDEDLAYLCGLVVAEGSWSDTYVDITIGDEEVHDWLVKRWGASKQRKDSEFHYRISSVHLVDFINWLGICKRAKNKNIPAKVMKWPKKFQAAFISGMFDGDGCANHGRQRITYTTVSDALAKQLQVVLLNYGIFSRRRLVHKKANIIGDRTLPPSDAWVIEITHSMARLFAKEIGFRLERKQQIAESYSGDGERAGGYDRHFNRADLGVLPTKLSYISRCKTIKSDTYDLLPNKPYYDGMAADYIESVEDSFANCYDFCVPETHSYFSNGFVSHNTADGMNHFYDVVKQAQEPNSGIEHLFLPWHMLKEYERPISKESRLYDLNKYVPTDYDMKLFSIFEKAGYPEDSWLHKVSWYDYVLSTEAKGDTDYMNSEYPSCVVAGTRVGTSDGIIPIEEAYDGIEATLGKVSKTHKQPKSPVAKITTAKGFELIGTYDHPIKTKDGFVDLIDSIGKTALLLPPRTSDDPYTLSWNELGVIHSITVTESLGEWLGYWMGDGSYSGGVLDFALCLRDKDVIERIYNLTKSIFGLDMHGRVVGSKGGGYNLRVGSTGLKEIFFRLGISKHRPDRSIAKNLRVPEIIWRSPKSIQQAFLRGLFEADGFIGKTGKRNGYIKLFTKSADFAKDVQLLLLANGIVARRRLIIKRSKMGGKEYPGTELCLGSVAGKIYADKIGFMGKFKNDRMSLNHDPAPNAKPMLFEDEIISVEPMGEDYTYNLTIPGPDTFDANGIWTHNTAEESFSASGRPVLPLKVINFWMKQDHPYTAIAPVAKTDKRSMQLKVQFEPDTNSPIRRYIEPKPGHKYMIAVDCAEGYAGDMSAGVIIDIKDMEEVCSFVVDYEQNDLAEVVVDLAKYYNNARIVPEKNMAGLFVESVQLLGYWNLYVDPEYKGPQTNKMFGIRTTVATKNEAINRLKFLMNNGIYKAHDKVFMEQAIHYSWKQLPSGGSKAEAVGQDDDGNPWHDDAIACRLTLVLALDFRQYKDYLGKDRNG